MVVVARLLQKASHLRSLVLSHHPKSPPPLLPLLHSIITNTHYYCHYCNTTIIPPLFRHLSTTTPTNGFNGKDGGEPQSSSWLFEEEDEEEKGKGWAEELKPWSLDEDEEEHEYGQEPKRREAVFEVSKVGVTLNLEEDPERKVAVFHDEEKELLSVLQGPKRVFGDLIAASGITDAMLDSLIALKDFEGVDGLPPLREIEDIRYEKSTRKSMGAEIQRQKQEEAAKARVRKVDEKGRAYGTGKRKCSIACVWIQPGEGKFLVNDKDFDAYFPMLDHRAALLQPFCETKTLGLWDVKCTVKGGGVSGQVGAIQLGVSRALQNWEPDLRPPLRKGGYLTRDSRVVERKKPGKAKARKSFQWVKR